MPTHPLQAELPLPRPGLDDPAVLAQAQTLFDRRPYWQRRYGSLVEALADAQCARVLLICARQAWLSQPPRRR